MNSLSFVCVYLLYHAHLRQMIVKFPHVMFFKHFLHSLEDHLLPRYFVVYKDGSAEELLREEDYSGFLREAEKDPMVAVMKPVDQRENDVTGITILRPFKGKFYLLL